MLSNFWSAALEAETDEKGVETNVPKKVTIKHQVAEKEEEVQELAVDIYTTEDRIYIVTPLAGVRSPDLEIGVDENVVTISGIRRNPFEEQKEAMYSSECFWGKFERKLSLPAYVDTRDISATFRNGILLIEAPRIAPAGNRRVKIN
ncbi:MAG TPA: Hsp20/alpha crystallin family protein [Candidatus Gracilibacteria bacterium]|nr:Hsp20/alpha crystallin family protein [Candidatus Gracilibacteria bacterium]